MFVEGCGAVSDVFVCGGLLPLGVKFAVDDGVLVAVVVCLRC